MSEQPIKPPVKFELTDGDKINETWRRLRKHLEARVDVLHRELENDAPEIEHAKRRGRIAELRALLALDKTPNT